ncbi:GNAT family N-acetyltransferase [Dickeya chrysanthemi]|uniref:GNAT family N-acetyltransferase n=1 Tax=Dickeya chrysanthemi TaxID=556 RepID=A0ABU8JKL2_DICCH
MNDSSNDKKGFKVQTIEFNETLKGVKDFDCGDATLNSYLQKQLKREYIRGNINALLLLDKIDNVIGFVTARPYHLGREQVLSGVFPYSIPPAITVMQIPMVAIDKKYQNKGWGIVLMRDIFDYCLDSAKQVKGIKGVYIDALVSARPFYESLNFQAMSENVSQHGTVPMLISMDTLREASVDWKSAG